MCDMNCKVEKNFDRILSFRHFYDSYLFFLLIPTLEKGLHFLSDTLFVRHFFHQHLSDKTFRKKRFGFVRSGHVITEV